MLVESEMRKGILSDCQIVECDLSNLEVPAVTWRDVELRDLHANDIRFMGTSLDRNTFTRCSLMRAGFLTAKLLGTTLDGLTLIKSQWIDCAIERSHIKNSVLQRSRFINCRIVSSSFVDFEGLNVDMNQCVIAHSMFGLSYGSGMNGLSGGSIRNCIFYNCVFDGYPLRGAEIENCVFIHCSGQIGEDMECVNVAGLGLRGHAEHLGVQDRAEAGRVLAGIREQ
jgi:uncharacterized protein YjbI with pentapeptide repeats